MTPDDVRVPIGARDRLLDRVRFAFHRWRVRHLIRAEMHPDRGSKLLVALLRYLEDRHT